LSAVWVSRRFPANVDQACNLAKSVKVESDARVFRPPWRRTTISQTGHHYSEPDNIISYDLKRAKFSLGNRP